jgi:hypothetical protein
MNSDSKHPANQQDSKRLDKGHRCERGMKRRIAWVKRRKLCSRTTGGTNAVAETTFSTVAVTAVSMKSAAAATTAAAAPHIAVTATPFEATTAAGQKQRQKQQKHCGRTLQLRKWLQQRQAVRGQV